MSTSSKYSLDELLLQSQRLTSLVGRDGVGGAGTSSVLSSLGAGGDGGRIKRGISELQESSRLLVSGAAGDGSAPAYVGAAAAPSSSSSAAAGQRLLLSGHAFDAEKLTHDINSMEFEAPGSGRPERFEGTDVEGYLAHHHDVIVLGAIDGARRASENASAAMERRWAAKDWKEARQHFIENLGHRSQSWRGGLALASSAREDRPAAVVQPSPLPLPPASRQAAATPSRALPSALLFSPLSARKQTVSVSRPAASALRPGGMSAAPQASMHLPPRPRALTEHASVVRRLSRSTFAVRNEALDSAKSKDSFAYQNLTTLRFRSSPIIEMLECTQDSIDSFGDLAAQGFTSNADLLGYRTCLQMMSDMIVTHAPSGSSSTSSDAGFFAPLSLPDDLVAADKNADGLRAAAVARRRILTAGSKSFFEKLFESILADVVSVESQRNNFSNSFRQLSGSIRITQLATFVDAKLKSGGVPNICMYSPLPLAYGSRSEVPLWPLVYTCLRIGDLRLAADLLRSAASSDDESLRSGIDVDIIVAIEGFIEMSNALSKVATFQKTMESSVLDVPDYKQRLREAIRGCRDLFEASRQLIDSGASMASAPPAYLDPVRLDVLNLLSVFDVEEMSDDAANESLESYLWCHLWFIQWSRELAINAPEAGAQASSIVKTSALSFSEESLYANIMDAGGAAYFDPDGTTPFNYAKALFACGAIGEAILHMWNSSRSFAAAHFTVIALHYGLILPNTVLSDAKSVSASSGSRHFNISSTVDITPAKILQKWTSSTFVPGLIEECVEYLMALDVSTFMVHLQCDERTKARLQDASSAVLESALEQLIAHASAEDVTVLVGDVSAATGMRERGILDDYFSRKFVDSLISKTAYSFLSVNRNPVEALRLYFLCGRYVEVLEEMCNQLSRYCLLRTAFGADLIHGDVAPSSATDSTREFWISTALEFHNTYIYPQAEGTPVSQPFALSSTSSHAVVHPVRRALEQSGHNDLLQTFVTLLNLAYFADEASKKRWAEALSFVDATKIVPSRERDVHEAVHRLVLLHSSIRQVADDLLILVAVALRARFCELSRDRDAQASQFEAVRSGGSVESGVARLDRALEDLRLRSAALTSFAATAKPSLRYADTPGRVAVADISVL